MGRKAIWAAALMMVVGSGSGCAILDGITDAMIDAGVLNPTPADLERRCRLDSGLLQDGVVEVRTGSGRGTGIVVEGGFILTAAHVVSGASRVTIARPSYIPTASPECSEATVVWRDTGADTALIAPNAPSNGLPCGTATDGPAMLVTLAVRGRSLTGPTRGVCVRKAWLRGNHRFEVEGGARPGDSGSAFIQNGRVVGILRGPERYNPVSHVTAALAGVRRTRVVAALPSPAPRRDQADAARGA